MLSMQIASILLGVMIASAIPVIMVMGILVLVSFVGAFC